ncbi:hypothetical protein GALMADRAFT_480255 [Galerina marginata CBS 339.88]|uniref:Uncharacterized protein n=1 Tax=Galerina marginata (strain CBS 339.88) TaxID=685588 RepID=A0A067SZS3_GALM3|nr:hypothetical protein GALMADRAFT_480255 [Galerina marginata CBS 339.88]
MLALPYPPPTGSGHRPQLPFDVGPTHSMCSSSAPGRLTPQRRRVICPRSFNLTRPRSCQAPFVSAAA